MTDESSSSAIHRVPSFFPLILKALKVLENRAGARKSLSLSY